LNASDEIALSSSDEEDESAESDMLANIMTYVGALRMCETVFQEKLSERDELLSTLEKKIVNLNKVIAKQSKSIRKLHNNLNYYKNKSQDELVKRKNESLSLDAAVVKVINDLIASHQRYKLMSHRNIGSAIAKAVFNPEFAGGVALPAVIKEAKLWLRKYVFHPRSILKQMDLRGGTLNYEGIAVLNDVESAAMDSGKRRQYGRMIPTPASLQKVAKILEMHGEQLCPFKSIKTQFGEGIEFIYAKTTRLVSNAFGLEDIGKTRPINISASIDAAKLSKNLTHTSSGLKMSDISGRNPMKNNQCFIVDDSSLQDLQSRNTVFLMKIVLTKETKDSIKLFEDVFQFFCLAGLPQEDRLADEKNLPKYEWQHLNDLRPLEVTSTTDMSADWKLSGVGGGVKNTKMFCTLCPCSSEGVHQPAETQCLRFCHERNDGWYCYHHPILCADVREI
jgi:hypothetical protein